MKYSLELIYDRIAGKSFKKDNNNNNNNDNNNNNNNNNDGRSYSKILQNDILSNNDTKNKLNKLYEKHNFNLNSILIKNFGESKKIPTSWYK